VLIGGGGEKKTLRIVAQHADIWHSFADTETLERKLGVLRGHCEAIGRDFGEIEISTGTRPHTEAEPDPIPAMEAQHALGATLFTLGITGPGLDPSPVADLLAWRDEVNAR
jgi:alkanesulfonate monooxygenase SsuD/methylene tetrahydromethanopterin reductase-like flavin-dependent oxidoreductase (luciferase family)